MRCSSAAAAASASSLALAASYLLRAEASEHGTHAVPLLRLKCGPYAVMVLQQAAKPLKACSLGILVLAASKTA